MSSTCLKAIIRRGEYDKQLRLGARRRQTIWQHAQRFLQAVLHLSLERGMGLAGCWVAAVAFQVIRLALNSARLLRRKSVLSRTEPLPDALADVEARLQNARGGKQELVSRIGMTRGAIAAWLWSVILVRLRIPMCGSDWQHQSKLAHRYACIRSVRGTSSDHSSTLAQVPQRDPGDADQGFGPMLQTATRDQTCVLDVRDYPPA